MSSYAPPEWGGCNCHKVGFEVLKSGLVVEMIDMSTKDFYVIGRQKDAVDILLEHPSISRTHAVVQHTTKGEMFLFDLGSTHGTVINKQTINSRVHAPLHVGDIIKFGQSTRLFVVTGPQELMPPEITREVEVPKVPEEPPKPAEPEKQKIKPQILREAQTGLVMWGQAEDAPEEEEDEQSGALDDLLNLGKMSDKQRKLVEKIQAKHSKIDHLNSEMERIRGKQTTEEDLSAGQQHRLTANQTRIAQLEQEVAELEEQLRESLGAREKNRKIKKKKRGDGSDSDDEFFDRTRTTAHRNATKQQTEYVAPDLIDDENTLREKLALLEKERQECREKKEKILAACENSTTTAQSDDVDPLDAYMAITSVQTERDKAGEIDNRLGDLEKEEKRLLYLLKIVTPSIPGLKPPPRAPVSAPPASKAQKKVPEVKKENVRTPMEISPITTPAPAPVKPDTHTTQIKSEVSSPSLDPTPAPTLTSTPTSLTKPEMVILGHNPKSKAPPPPAPTQLPATDINVRVGGLQVRKAKPTAVVKDTDTPSSPPLSPTSAPAIPDSSSPSFAIPKRRRVLGPTMPDRRAVNESDEISESGSGVLDGVWQPPQDQTGDGRTALNEKLGY